MFSDSRSRNSEAHCPAVGRTVKRIARSTHDQLNLNTSLIAFCSTSSAMRFAIAPYAGATAAPISRRYLLSSPCHWNLLGGVARFTGHMTQRRCP